MDAPTCKLCRTVHWPRDPCRFVVDPVPAATRKVHWPAPKQAAPPVAKPCARCVELETEVARLKAEVMRLSTLSTTAQSVDKPVDTVDTAEARRAYKREWMRKQRATGKA